MSDMPERMKVFRRIGADVLHIGDENETMSWGNTDGATYVRDDLHRNLALDVIAAETQAAEAYAAQLKAETEFKMVLDREASTQTRHDKRMEAAEAMAAKLAEALQLYSCEDVCNGCPKRERGMAYCGFAAREALAEYEASK